MNRAVVVVAKAPVAGHAKTRLAAGIGHAAAEALATAFIADVVETVATLDARPVLAFAGDEHHPAFDPARRHRFVFRRQAEGDLGARLDAVVRVELDQADEILVIGSDSPTLQRLHFDEAWDSLERHEVVLGPSFDGGYYLIGVRAAWYKQFGAPRETHPLFDGVEWSTSRVLGQTLRRARQCGALCDLIRFCYDVDTPEDLEMLKIHLLEHLRPSGLDVAQNTAILLSNTSTD